MLVDARLARLRSVRAYCRRADCVARNLGDPADADDLAWFSGPSTADGGHRLQLDAVICDEANLAPSSERRRSVGNDSDAQQLLVHASRIKTISISPFSPQKT